MKIVVCIKQVPGTTDVEVDPKTGVLKRDGVDSKLNPYDLYALETALRIKQAHGATVRAVTMGPPQAAQILREAYMMGVDEGVLLTDRRFAGADVLATAYALSQGIRQGGVPDLVICGKMTTDGDTAQVGPEIAEFLDLPHVANVLRILEVGAEAVTVEMDMAATVEVAKVRYPCLITVEKGICQPRLPSFRLKLATRERPIAQLSLADLPDQDPAHYGLNGSPTQVKRIFPPEVNANREHWTGPGPELAERLGERLHQLKFV
ncbi:MAG: electron transfer flavoprotein subunit beta/FixA family protein [Holophaga sp.]|nr:electron transfer flavoprotein subunit beta/FixA family protein [Holophaga sp.]